MLRITLIAIIWLLASVPSAQSEALFLERLVAPPNLEGVKAQSFASSPQGDKIAYLRAEADTPDRYDLWLYSLTSGDNRRLIDAAAMTTNGAFAKEEWARRQRIRRTEAGIAEFDWSSDGARLLLPLNGDLYVYDLKTSALNRLTATDAAEIDARFAPLGNFISYVRDRDLYLLNSVTGKERRLTRSDDPLVRYGLADFVSAEEVHRLSGYWWSPDGRSIAVVESDARALNDPPTMLLFATGEQTAAEPYPQAGEENVKNRLLIIDVASGRHYGAKFNLKDDYLARVSWLPDGQGLLVITQSRDQRRLTVRVLDRRGDNVRTLLEEKSDAWINISDDYWVLQQARILVWGSEREGKRRLYAVDWSGKINGPLTPPSLNVDRLVSVVEDAGRLFVEGWIEDPLERHLYALDLDPSTDDAPVRLTAEPGWHAAALFQSAKLIVDRFSDAVTPPSILLRNLDGTVRVWLVDNRITPGHPYAPYLDHHVMPQFGTLAAEDGAMLHYRLYRPTTPGRHPVIVHLYGGPSVQLVNRSWSPPWYQAALAKGYAIFSLDNRGTARRGVAFETALHGMLGAVETRDQQRGIEFLKSQSFIDPQRIALYGWSYGGYLALKMAAASKDVRAIIAGAPVTDWRLYDTHYSERFLGLPQENPAAYDASGVFADLANLHARPLLVHGLADDNVRFVHTSKLMAALQRRNMPFDVMLYPGAGHRLNGAEEAHFFRTMFDFLDRELGQQ
ncbi:MAG: alpha/beta fold hydrolase [Sphingomonadales bacterium]|nr:alpha/beta fold hydrolase [Sphingomonadales bacterium]